jgi:hypothetical protein
MVEAISDIIIDRYRHPIGLLSLEAIVAIGGGSGLAGEQNASPVGEIGSLAKQIEQSLHLSCFA